MRLEHRFLAVATMLAFVPSFLTAQVPATDIPGRSLEDVERAKKAQEEAQKAAKAAKQPEVQAGAADVTFEQVMADPDNIELNYAYAKAQVRRGNLKGSVSTLERILMVNPDLPKIRLFYAVVLFRLDNLVDAEKELETLKKGKLQPGLRAELEAYIAQIHRRRRQTHFSLVTGAGFDFDENRNAAPAHGEFMIGDGVGTLDANSTRKNDTSVDLLASARVDHDLGFQSGHTVFLSGTYYQAEQTKIKTINLKSFSYSGGGTYKSRVFNVTPAVEFNHLELAQTTYMRSWGFSARLECRLTAKIDGFGKTGYARQVYQQTAVVPTGPQRDGDNIYGTLGWSYPLTPSQKLTMSFTHTNQGAVQKFNAYTRDNLSFDHAFLLGKGQFLLTNLDINFDRYERPERAISIRARKDDTYRAKLTYGFPLGFFGKIMSNAVFNVSYEYYQAFSNILNYGYTNNKLSSLLTYKFEM